MYTIASKTKGSFLLVGLSLLFLQEVCPSRGHAMHTQPDQPMVETDGPSEQNRWWRKALVWYRQHKDTLYTTGIVTGIALCGAIWYSNWKALSDLRTNVNEEYDPYPAINLDSALCKNALDVIDLPLKGSAVATLAHLFPTQWLIEAGKSVYECCSNVLNVLHDAKRGTIYKGDDTHHFCVVAPKHIDIAYKVLSSIKPAVKADANTNTNADANGEERCFLPHKHSQKKEELY